MTTDQLIDLRNAMSLTQAEMASLLRLSPQAGRKTIRDWEKGKRPIPGPAQVALELIRDALVIKIMLDKELTSPRK